MLLEMLLVDCQSVCSWVCVVAWHAALCTCSEHRKQLRQAESLQTEAMNLATVALAANLITVAAVVTAVVPTSAAV